MNNPIGRLYSFRHSVIKIACNSMTPESWSNAAEANVGFNHITFDQNDVVLIISRYHFDTERSYSAQHAKLLRSLRDYWALAKNKFIRLSKNEIEQLNKL